MRKIRYEIDPHNRLIETGGGLRRVIEGEFHISDNQLVFCEKNPVPGSDFQQVKFSGRWSIDRQKLVLCLDKWGRQIAGNKLVLRAGLLSANGSEVVFIITNREIDRRQTISLLSLSGRWQIDGKNRLSFIVEKGAGSGGEIVLGASWDLNKRHEIEYRYGSGEGSSFALRGRWEITAKDRLSYSIEGASSKLDIKAWLEHAFSDRLVFTCGAGGQVRNKRIVFFGSWKIGKLGLEFELKGSGHRASSFRFGAAFRPCAGTGVTASLTNTEGKGLGVELVLTKTVAGGEAFLRLLRESGQAGIFAGYGKSF